MSQIFANQMIIFAQMVEDPQILDQIKDNFNYFIESGQVWALIVGFVLGFLFKSFTAY